MSRIGDRTEETNSRIQFSLGLPAVIVPVGHRRENTLMIERRVPPFLLRICFLWAFIFSVSLPLLFTGCGVSRNLSAGTGSSTPAPTVTISRESRLGYGE